MTSDQIKIPGLDYPLIAATVASRLVVSVAGRVIADCRETLTPRAAKYPAVQYIPHTDIDIDAGRNLNGHLLPNLFRASLSLRPL